MEWWQSEDYHAETVLDAEEWYARHRTNEVDASLEEQEQADPDEEPEPRIKRRWAST